MRKITKKFIDLSLSLKLSGIYVTTQSRLTDTKEKNLTTSDPNKNTTLAKKEDTSSASEALTEIIFLSRSDYNRFVSLIFNLKQDMLKGSDN